MNFTTSRCESSGQLRLAYMFYLCVCVYSPYSSPPPFFHGALPRDFNNSRSNSGRAPKQRDKRRSDMQAALLCEAVAAAATPFATCPLPSTTPYPGLSSSVLAPPLGRHSGHLWPLQDAQLKWKIIPNSIANEIEGEKAFTIHLKKDTHILARTNTLYKHIPCQYSPKHQNSRFFNFDAYKLQSKNNACFWG